MRRKPAAIAGCLLVAGAAGAYAVFYFYCGASEIRGTLRPDELTVATGATPDVYWPGWRGGAANNVVPIAASSGGKGSAALGPLRWKTSLPGVGHSTPCIWGERLLVTVSDAAAETVHLLCLAVDDGRVVWQTELERGRLPELHLKNTHASASPATDGVAVYVPSVSNGKLWVSAVGLDGRRLWKCQAGPYQSEWGYGSSPALYGGMVIVAGDCKGARIDRLTGSSFLAALNCRTGEIVWRIKRLPGDSFGTPIVARVAERDQLLLPGKQLTAAYDPATGAELWTCRWSIERAANTVAFDERRVYASGKFPAAELICIRADGAGDVTDTHLLWREKKGACDIPSPVAVDGEVYALGDDGVLTALSTADGKTVWKRRLGGNISASPLAAGRTLICGNEEGTLYLISLDDRDKAVVEQPLGAGLYASPIVAGGHLYVRTQADLQCYALTEPTSSSEAEAAELSISTKLKR